MRTTILIKIVLMMTCWTSSVAAKPADERTITAVITWSTKFATVAEENNVYKPAANPCWPFSISVISAAGAATVFTGIQTASRYRLAEDMHVCTFEIKAPVGVPLEIMPSARNFHLFDGSPLPPAIRRGPITIRFRRGFTPRSRPWTLGKKGVYVTFTYGMVTG